MPKVSVSGKPITKIESCGVRRFNSPRIKLLLFLAFNGHLWLLALLADTFQTLPIDATPLHAGGFMYLVTHAGMIFSQGGERQPHLHTDDLTGHAHGGKQQLQRQPHRRTDNHLFCQHPDPFPGVKAHLRIGQRAANQNGDQQRQTGTQPVFASIPFVIG